MTNWWWGPTVSGRIMVLLEPGAEILQAQKVTRLAARSLCPQKVFHCCCWGYFILDPIHMAGLGLTRSKTENSTDNLPNSYTPKPSGWLKQLHSHWGLEALIPRVRCKMANLWKMHDVDVFLFTFLLECLRNFSCPSKLSLEEDPSFLFGVPIKWASHCHQAVFSSSNVCMVFLQDFRHLVNVQLKCLLV